MLDRLTSLIDRLGEIGLTATTEAQDVPVPGAWIAVRTAARETMCPGLTMTADVYVIVPDSGALIALERLTGYVEAVYTAGLRPTSPVRLDETVVLPHDPTPLPAARIPLDL